MYSSGRGGGCPSEGVWLFSPKRGHFTSPSSGNNFPENFLKID